MSKKPEQGGDSSSSSKATALTRRFGTCQQRAAINRNLPEANGPKNKSSCELLKAWSVPEGTAITKQMNHKNKFCDQVDVPTGATAFVIAKWDDEVSWEVAETLAEDLNTVSAIAHPQKRILSKKRFVCELTRWARTAQEIGMRCEPNLVARLNLSHDTCNSADQGDELARPSILLMTIQSLLVPKLPQ
jgi:hypothetical protein